jgi:hypothetical protein
VKESTQETKTEKETSSSRVEADENRQQTFQKFLRVPAPPLKNNNSTTTTKMFADIVQKTQTKPPFDNRNFSFPKSSTKIFANITKRSVSKQKRRENRSISSPKNRNFLFFVSLRAMQTYAKRFRATKSKAVVRKETTKSSATPCTYTNQTANHLLLNYSLSFFHFCPVILNLTDCRDPSAHRFSITRVKIWREEKTGTGSD